MNITPKLIAVPGRVLASPNVKYGRTKVVQPRSVSWNLQSVEFITKAELSKWTYLRISLNNARQAWPNDTEFENSLKGLSAMLRGLGMSAQNHMPGQHIWVEEGDVESEIDEAIHRFATHRNRPQLIFAIIPSQVSTVATAAYNRVKLACDVKKGIVNVCVLDSKFARANEQYYANVALKFNLKLGGRNHTVDPSKLGLLQEGKTMVVGIDVTHPSPGSASNAPSVAGIVASVDWWLAQWPADLRIQPPLTETVEGLDVLLKSRLQLWRKYNNGQLPENILVYRDGVSEGEYNMILEKELPLLRKACAALYPATATKQEKPNISIIVVGKRHNTRFYPTKKQEADRSWNPQNGTVVDRGVTEARNWDFFLQAHTAIQGTARPAHYYVVYDQIFRDRRLQAPFRSAADALEDLTHNMCYLFGRATKAVSVCPPAYYADLVCERARRYLSSVFEPSPLASPTESTAGGSVAGTDQSELTIHSNVCNTMFYT